MSAYITGSIAVDCAEDIVAGLVALGVPRESIEIHDEPVGLRGHHDDLRPEKAHVVVRRKVANEYLSNTGAYPGASNDVGFIRSDNGQWTEVVSEYDRNKWYTRARDRLAQEGAVSRLIREAAKRGVPLRRIESRDSQGRLVVELAPDTRARPRAARQRARA